MGVGKNEPSETTWDEDLDDGCFGSCCLPDEMGETVSVDWERRKRTGGKDVSLGTRRVREERRRRREERERDEPPMRT